MPVDPGRCMHQAGGQRSAKSCTLVVVGGVGKRARGAAACGAGGRRRLPCLDRGVEC
jgi:hypothetical protein